MSDLKPTDGPEFDGLVTQKLLADLLSTFALNASDGDTKFAAQMVQQSLTTARAWAREVINRRQVHRG